MAEDDVNFMSEQDAIIKSLMSRQKLIKSYIQVYFTQFLFRLKNKYVKEEPKFIPEEWKLNPIKDKDVIDKFMKLIVKRNNVNFTPVEYNILGPFADIVLNFGKNIELILGKSQIYDCKGSPMIKDILFNENEHSDTSSLFVCEYDYKYIGIRSSRKIS